MPFIFVSFFWNKINNLYYLGVKKGVRQHGDNIIIDPNSPDAFEEIFWAQYIKDYKKNGYRKILDYNYENKILKKFIDINTKKILYIRKKPLIYLSKGNYFIYRLKYLLKEFPQTKIILCIRDPIQQCLSAKKIDERFLLENNKNKYFALRLDYLCHFEFGFNKKSIIENNNENIKNLNSEKNYEYYLKEWIYTYKFVVNNYLNDKKLLKNLIIIDYNELVKNKKSNCKKIYNFCNLELNDKINNFIEYQIFQIVNNDLNIKRNIEIINLEKEAYRIYKKIKDKNILLN